LRDLGNNTTVDTDFADPGIIETIADPTETHPVEIKNDGCPGAIVETK
jgi:hypothetical protein